MITLNIRIVSKSQKICHTQNCITEQQIRSSKIKNEKLQDEKKVK